MKREPWQIAAARFCVENSEKGFKKEDLFKFINNTYSVNNQQMEYFFEEEIFSPPGRKFSRNDVAGVWVPPLDLVSKVTDYDELN